MVEIEKPRIECIDSPEDASYGRYIVEPLERGYGTTLGNSLRRILLSPDEARLLRGALLAFRNKLLSAGKPTEDVNELIIKVMR